MLILSFFGEVTPPDNPIYNASVCGSGMVILANIGLKLIFVVAGIFALWKFIEAGFTFMNAGGDPQKVANGRDKMIMTFVGLLVMFGAFALAMLVGQVFLGDSSAILNPSIMGVGECPPA